MLQLLINGRFLTQPVTGVQRYARQLLDQFDKMLIQGEIDPNQYRLTCLVPPGLAQDPGWKRIELRTTGALGGNSWEQIDLALSAPRRLLFNPCNSSPLLRLRQATTLHDAAVFACPQAFTLPFRLKYQALLLRLRLHNAALITVSAFSQGELQRWCGIPLARTVVVPNAGEHILANPADPGTLQRLPIRRPFFLALANPSPHKNIVSAIQAAAQMQAQGVQLVLAGQAGAANFRSAWRTDQLPANVLLTGPLSDAELRALYEAAAGFLFPSLYEGFGIPLLEAMHCRCPVIASPLASIPEVCGEAACYSPDASPEALARQMQALLTSPAMADELRQRGRLRAAQFSWQNTARLTWQVLAGAQ